VDKKKTEEGNKEEALDSPLLL